MGLDRIHGAKKGGMMTEENYWNLQAEKNYLNGLGSWTSNYRVVKPRHVLLMDYLETIHYRSEFWIADAYAYAYDLLMREYPRVFREYLAKT